MSFCRQCMVSTSSSATSTTLTPRKNPKIPDYPKNPEFKKRFGPRGVLHTWADGKGGQKIEDTGPLTKKRMETIDDEVTEHALRFIDEAHKADKPFFIWYNTTAMHFRTHLADKHKGKSGQGDYNDVMVAHDENIGTMLNKLDELGIAEDTIVMYSTDNGVHYNSWPDAGITPFRSEKNTNWEGGWRVPAFVRWPGKIKAGSVVNGIVTHQDWLATFLAAAGEPDIKEKLLKGHKVGNKTYKVHIDGFNMLPYLSGEVKESPREFFFYFSDDGEIIAIRMQDWKVVLMEQRAKTLQCWFEPFVRLRAPKISTCAAIRSNAPTKTRTPTGTGLSPTSTSSTRCRRWWPNKSRTSRSFRRARSQPRSIWTRCCGHWRTRAAAQTTDRLRVCVRCYRNIAQSSAIFGPGGPPRRADSQGGEACRSAGRSIVKLRVCHQPQDRQGAWPRRAGQGARQAPVARCRFMAPSRLRGMPAQMSLTE